MKRDTLFTYVTGENERNGYGVSLEGIECAVHIMEFVGGDLYRPLTRLLLSNWNEIAERIALYTEEDWTVARQISSNIKNTLAQWHPDENCHLSDIGVAIFLEMLEGDDTMAQALGSEKPISAEELRRIRSR